MSAAIKICLKCIDVSQSEGCGLRLKTTNSILLEYLLLLLLGPHGKRGDILWERRIFMTYSISTELYMQPDGWIWVSSDAVENIFILLKSLRFLPSLSNRSWQQLCLSTVKVAVIKMFCVGSAVISNTSLFSDMSPFPTAQTVHGPLAPLGGGIAVFAAINLERKTDSFCLAHI